jgi:hypothetical protein
MVKAKVTTVTYKTGTKVITTVIKPENKPQQKIAKIEREYIIGSNPIYNPNWNVSADQLMKPIGYNPPQNIALERTTTRKTSTKIKYFMK